MNQQAKVWADVKKARTLLKAARQLEHEIEVQRIQTATRLARQHGYHPDNGVTNSDPLGGRLDKVIEELKEILS